MKKQMTIDEFCDKHNACIEGREWAIANCKTMLDAFKKAKYDWALWIVTRPGVLSGRDLRLFTCWCVENTPLSDGGKVGDLLTDARSTNCIEVAKRCANGLVTEDELDAARDAAWAAEAAARAAVRDAAGDAQLKQLRKLKPNFDVAGGKNE